MLVNKPVFLQIHTCAEQSPVCLVKSHTGPCTHKHCLLAYQKPQYWGISIREFYSKEVFSEFDIHKKYGKPHIIPRNPNPGNDNDFEVFRQSLNAISHLAGSWPAALETVQRDHVEFRWTEFTDSYPVTNPETLATEWNKRADVQEYAYYVGPIQNPENNTVDLDAIYQQPEECVIVAAADVINKPNNQVTFNLQYLTPDHAIQLINMFDSAQAYAENFSALKAITRGLCKTIENTNPQANSPIGRMFKTVNRLQGLLLLDDMQEVESIISNSGLMPDPWYGFRSKKGGAGC